MNFKELLPEGPILEALEMMGFHEATPIQQQAIPLIVQKKDLIACAQTGTGKTAAFMLPVLQLLSQNTSSTKCRALVLAPTRELAIQIDRQIDGFSYYTGVGSAPVYGGNDSELWERQKMALESGCDVIVATPGRLISHIALGYVDFSSIEYFILDEADRMLDMGFYDDIMRIAKQLPAVKQTLMFSATMPPKIRTLAKQILNEPAEISISISKPAAGVTQAAFMVHEEQKIELIKHLTRFDDIESLIIFSSTKLNVKKIHETLLKKGFSTVSIQSDMDQKEREEALRSFANHRAKILVATDVVSRGIDIDNINMVLNYDVPDDPEDYIHRIGRTARASATGEAITFITEKDQHKFKRIEELMEMEVRKIPLPEHVGPGPEYNPGAGRHKSSGRSSSGGKGGRKGGGKFKKSGTGKP